ncbi:hypothetical protein [Bacillus cereus group sp. MYBK57-1]|uniref:hypothetical protein n=1 Tax=Bacillus cereus group sp. MYBK57-1 TaxID=3450619 RepID=UPI003F7979C9
MEKQIGLIHNQQFYQIILHKNPTTFKENIKQQVSRTPRPLSFSNENEGKVVVISWDVNGEGNKPFIEKNTEQLPTEVIDLLLKESMESPCTFLPATLGGSTQL